MVPGKAEANTIQQFVQLGSVGQRSGLGIAACDSAFQFFDAKLARAEQSSAHPTSLGDSRVTLQFQEARALPADTPSDAVGQGVVLDDLSVHLGVAAAFVLTGAAAGGSAVAGGGRYDGLVKALGGPDIPGTGFAIGFDRLAEITGLNNADYIKTPDIFLAALGEKSQSLAFIWKCALGLEGVKAEMDFGDRSLKSQMKYADRLGSKHVLIIGDSEIKEGAVILRDMTTKAQVSIPIENIVNELIAKIM